MASFGGLGRHQFVKDFSVLFSGAAAAQAIPLIASPLLARIYTPSEMGMWSLYTSVVLTCVTFSALRLDVAIVAAPDTLSARGLRRAASRSNLVFAALFTAAAPLFAGALAADLGASALERSLYWAGLNIFALGQYQIYTYWMNRRKAYGLMSQTRLAQAGAVNSLQLGLGAIGLGVNGLVLGTVVGHVLSLFHARLKAPASPRNAEKDPPLGQVLRANWRMPILNGVSAIADAIRINGVNFAIATAYSQQSLGFFSLAWRTVLMPISLISSTLGQVFYQRFSVTPNGAMGKTAAKGGLLCAALGVPPFAFLAFWAEPLFGWVFGAEWRAAGRLAELLTPYLYLTFVTSPLSTLFLVVRQQSLLMTFSIAYMIVPLVIVLMSDSGLQEMIWQLSQAMSVMLIIFLGLVALACRRFDRGAEQSDR